MWFVGELRNNGQIAAGAQIEVIARDINGILVDCAEFWPASIRNIPSGGTTGIEYFFESNSRIKTIEAKVVSVTVWP